MSNCFGFSNIVIPVTGLSYKGLWDANTNSPFLQSGVGTSGDYYIVSVAGTTNLDGITDWEVNDWAIFDGTAWQKIDNSQYTPTLQQVTDAGATTDKTISVEALQINTTPTTYARAVGKLGWDDASGTLEFQLKGGQTTLQIGQEQVARVVNKTVPLIDLLESNYQAVIVAGATGQRLSVRLAQANNDANSASTIGIVTETILQNQEGFICTSGLVNKINTTGSLQGETWADGDILYLSPTTPGAITNIKPVAPAHLVIIGYVEYAHAVNGKIFVKVDNGYELDELHNVYINPSTLTNNDALIYNSTSQLWENKQVTESVISLSDNTTNNVSTARHGFAPKLPNDANKYLDGTGNYTYPFAAIPVQSVTSAATVTPTAANELVVITAQAVGLTLANPSGSWVQGQPLIIRIKDDGTARAITWDTNYRAIGVTLLTTTIINKTTYVGIIYNSTDSKWDVIGVTTEA